MTGAEGGLVKRTRKKAREDAAEKALELACRWLHGHKMMLDEKITTDGLNTGMSIWSPGGKTDFYDWDFPSWDWAGEAVPREKAAFEVVAWLFSEDGDDEGDGPESTAEEVASEVSPGRRKIETRLAPVPKFSFSSLEEFVLKAEVSGEFQEEARK